MFMIGCLGIGLVREHGLELMMTRNGSPAAQSSPHESGDEAGAGKDIDYFFIVELFSVG
ncbi:MAG: hypothetical protein V8Q54_11375 [Alistipes senegalensis]